MYFEDFFARPPEKIIEWRDAESTAKGWLVLNSLRGGAAGGGTRMKKGCTEREVIDLAKTMEIKFSISGPQIGGAKSGIDYEPTSEHDKHNVLRRWFNFIAQELKTEYGTGGDYNVDQRRDILPLLAELGIEHPQEGIVRGHLSYLSRSAQDKIIKQLYKGVTLPIQDPFFKKMNFCIADVITGYGLIQAINAFYEEHDDSLRGKKIIIEGSGNVGASAAYFAQKEGSIIVGMLEKEWAIFNKKGIKIDELFFGNKHRIPTVYKHFLIEEGYTEADIFIPAATSGTISITRLDEFKKRGITLIACGANNPFNTTDTLSIADEQCIVLPDFIANAGMARTFAYLMKPDCSMSTDKIYADVAQIMKDTIGEICKHTTSMSKFFLGSERLVLERLRVNQL